MYQDNNLNVIKNDKDEQLVKQKVNHIISRIQRTFEKWWRRLCFERRKSCHDKIVESLNAVDDVVKNIFEKEKWWKKLQPNGQQY